MNDKGVEFIMPVHSFLNEGRCFSNETLSPNEQNKKGLKTQRKPWLFQLVEIVLSIAQHFL